MARIWKPRAGIAMLGALTLATLALSGGALLAAGSADDGADWPAYGRTGAAQHYSPLAEIDQGNVARLGLAWSLDLPLGNTQVQPLAVDGVLYFATGLSVVRAVDAATGRQLWEYDPQAAGKAGKNLRFGWGVRGIAFAQGKVITGTQDGRLIAIDAMTGKPVWSVQTYPSDYPAYISGAPRVFGDKVLIGYGGTAGPTRGYVTAYDVATGQQRWRFWTVPGNPADGFENEAMKMAARTWAGEWWKFGGGADVWNATAYDPETDTVYIGTGSGYPWNRQLRSADAKGDRGDNLFVCSIIALDGKTGAYKWHYQVVPGETWDFDATMDMELADITIAGKPRKVLIQAPKNGFFYVIDRITGQLISAEPFVPVTWAKGIDPKTGRPIEAEGARYRDGGMVFLQPSGMGGHNWMPMAYSPKSGLAYIPANQFEMGYGDGSKTWTIPTDRTVSGAVNIAGGEAMGRSRATGALLAWSPVTQKPVWRVEHPSYLNGGVLATGGGLVFQGTVDGYLTAYAADSGKVLWRFDAGAPLMGTPIAYKANGREYVSVITGLGMNLVASAGAIMGPDFERRYRLDPQTQARRVLTFALGGKGTLPAPASPAPPVAAADTPFDKDAAMIGLYAFAAHCGTCHGALAIGSTQGPDLRRSPLILDRAAFAQVVKAGALEARGMPRFGEFEDGKVEGLRQYLLQRSAELARDQAGQ
ncbi:PQQ-dependent dehydrogenase, methanol/ethanol family [Novosphingobium album (ex Liu et al. 2023)]|uniref:PQQ-dependent dehydrogenase, methanol/ethanol family n=1 Tax=Novosphingobium album (ex Liu et al. 2023) TaxID=3031130 RepID=A0ABT5WTS8_9SPHN|nr:PQQ-dependent dehydrogenase, methanol/ethanol family [Novosphingobium album (ex Liu et al. 2023)]MDE8653298.1 PQQ-dependent dehydrogenase, methanol/ethanol family [Novosphingobium album (ex Liu et al. 2023)]